MKLFSSKRWDEVIGEVAALLIEVRDLREENERLRGVLADINEASGEADTN